MQIYYTGVGSNETGVHTETEFLDIMRRYFNPYRKPPSREFKGWILPDGFTFFTLDDWLESVGANIM